MFTLIWIWAPLEASGALRENCMDLQPFEIAAALVTHHRPYNRMDPQTQIEAQRHLGANRTPQAPKTGAWKNDVWYAGFVHWLAAGHVLMSGFHSDALNQQKLSLPQCMRIGAFAALHGPRNFQRGMASRVGRSRGYRHLLGLSLVCWEAQRIDVRSAAMVLCL